MTNFPFMLHSTVPVEITDPINARILAVSEDRIAGFLEDPFVEIARLSEVPPAARLDRGGSVADARGGRRRALSPRTPSRVSVLEASYYLTDINTDAS